MFLEVLSLTYHSPITILFLLSRELLSTTFGEILVATHVDGQVARTAPTCPISPWISGVNQNWLLVSD